MFIRRPVSLFLLIASALSASLLSAQSTAVDSYEQKATDVSQKRFEQKAWSNTKQSGLKDKAFPFKQWDSHYSGLGSKKSAISTKDSKDKERYKTDMMQFPTKERDISRLNGRLADLERQAQVSTTDTTQRIENKRIYESVMKESDNYADVGELLSLRDINRFQFRQNRSDGAVPVKEAGAGAGAGAAASGAAAER